MGGNSNCTTETCIVLMIASRACQGGKVAGRGTSCNFARCGGNLTTECRPIKWSVTVIPECSPIKWSVTVIRIKWSVTVIRNSLSP
jgi:hypothetical protein